MKIRSLDRFALAELLPLVFTLGFIGFFASGVFFWDEWDIVGLMTRMKTEGWTLVTLWAPHNEHRIFLSKLIYALSLQLSTDPRWLMALSAFVCWLSWRELSRALGLRNEFSKDRRPVVVFGLAAFFFFSWVQLENFAWGLCLCWFLAAYGNIGALSSLVEKRYGRFLLFFALSYLSLATWVALVPVVAAILLHHSRENRRRSLTILAGFVVLSGVLLWLYTNGVRAEHHDDMKLNPLLYPMRYASYMVMLFSVPFNPMGRHLSFAVGLVALILLLVHLGRKRASFRLLELALLAHAVILTALFAYSRAGKWTFDHTAPYRYATVLMPAWIVIFTIFHRSGWLKPRAKNAMAVFLAINLWVVASKGFDHEYGGARTRNEAGDCLKRVLEQKSLDLTAGPASADTKCALQIYHSPSVFETARAWLGAGGSI